MCDIAERSLSDGKDGGLGNIPAGRQDLELVSFNSIILDLRLGVKSELTCYELERLSLALFVRHYG